MRSGRLFTFGCSFTAYIWPTWADILGREFEHYENWGQLGAGNQYIFNSLIECNQRHRFTANDTVAVMWTNVAREDRYIHDQWITSGNIYHCGGYYDSSFIKKYTSERGYLIRDLATITASQDLLTHWGVNSIQLCMVPLDNVDQYDVTTSPDRDVVELYQPTLDAVRPSVYETIYNFDWLSRANRYAVGDKHPDTPTHLEFLQKVLPEYDISPDTIDWVRNYQHNKNYTMPDPERL